MDNNKELIADLEQAAKDIRSEGYQIAAGYYVKAAQALAASDARIAELEREVARNKDAAEYLAERTGRA